MCDTMSERGSESGTVQYACEEARDTLDQQIEKIHYEDQKAVKMARVNLIILGVLVSSFSFILSSQQLSSTEFLNSHSAVGALLLVASTILAGMAYSSSRMELGADPVVISEASEMAPEAFYSELNRQYTEWLEENDQVHSMNAYAIQWIIVLSITGMIFLIGGFTVGLVGERGDTLSFVLLAVEVLSSLFVAALISRSDSFFRVIQRES